MKKILIIIIVVITIALLGAFGTIYFLMNKANEPTEEEKLKAAQEEIDQLDAESLAKLQIEPINFPLKKVNSKHDFLRMEMTICVKDDAMLARVEGRKAEIIDSLNGIFEDKTMEELQGNRKQMKEPILTAVRDLFPKEEDKMQIISVLITQYLFQSM